MQLSVRSTSRPGRTCAMVLTSWRRCGDSPLQLVIGRRVLVGDVGEVSQDLGAVDGQAGEQDELLPRGAQQARVVLDGELAEERQLLDPRDLTEEELVGQTAQQGEQLHLGHPVPAARTHEVRVCVITLSKALPQTSSDLLLDTITRDGFLLRFERSLFECSFCTRSNYTFHLHFRVRQGQIMVCHNELLQVHMMRCVLNCRHTRTSCSNVYILRYSLLSGNQTSVWAPAHPSSMSMGVPSGASSSAATSWLMRV